MLDPIFNDRSADSKIFFARSRSGRSTANEEKIASQKNKAADIRIACELRR
jgi:hypothetical protein